MSFQSIMGDASSSSTGDEAFDRFVSSLLEQPKDPLASLQLEPCPPLDTMWTPDSLMQTNIGNQHHNQQQQQQHQQPQDDGDYDDDASFDRQVNEICNPGPDENARNNNNHSNISDLLVSFPKWDQKTCPPVPNQTSAATRPLPPPPPSLSFFCQLPAMLLDIKQRQEALLRQQASLSPTHKTCPQAGIVNGGAPATPPPNVVVVPTPEPQKPKKRLSAYNLFFRETRKQLLAKLPVPKGKKPDKRSHGKMGFADMGRTIANMWNEISPQDKLKFQDMAQQDKIRYFQEMEAYHAQRQQQAQGTTATTTTSSKMETAMHSLPPLQHAVSSGSEESSTRSSDSLTPTPMLFTPNNAQALVDWNLLSSPFEPRPLSS